jgi:hypothetical protein
LIVYLSSPGSQMHADHLAGMPVLVSYALYSPWVDDYQQSFGRLLIDSGAYSELTGNAKVDGEAYRDWSKRWDGQADAVAGLDDIKGDWRRSLQNYERFGGFPTIHDSDPPELLKDLIPIAREQGRGWLGIGLVPPRSGKEKFVRWACDNVPDDLHVHGWALREYTHVRRLGSVDSTNWFRDAWGYRNAMPFLTPAECVELVVKRYQRWQRVVRDPSPEPDLFSWIE